jgi:hypothetical protein
MSLLRATLLTAFLPALLPAAPAPLPRQKRRAEPGGWSQTIDGLRVRLLAPRTRYRVGETVRLVLEIQNVSDRQRAIEEPHLSHAIQDPRSAPGGWAITSERRADKEGWRRRRGRELWDEAKRSPERTKLPAGQTLRIEIEATDELRYKKLVEREKDEPRKEELYYPDASGPGVYDLRATFTPETRRRRVREGGWPGQPLTTPPVRIELEK